MPDIPSVPPSRLFVIACDVFRPEIEPITRKIENLGGLVWLEMSQHDRPDALRQQLQSAITEAATHDHVEAIALAYGLCGNAALGLRAERVPLVIPRAHDCIGILLGGHANYEQLKAHHSRCYWHSAGWIQGGRTPGPELFAQMKAHYEATFEPDEVEELMEAFLSQYAVYNESLYLDTGAPSKEEDLARMRLAADQLGWKVETAPTDLSFLHEIFFGPWLPPRFLVLQPGQSIALAHAADARNVLRAV
jgi:hypothetical protein